MAKSRGRTRNEGMRRAIGERLRAYIRQYCDGVQARLVERTGISATTMSEWFGKARRVPDAEQLLALSKAGINLNWLIAGDGPELTADLKLPADHLEGLRIRLVHALIAEFGSTSSEPSQSALPSVWAERMIDHVVPQAGELFQALLVLYRPWVRQTLTNPIIVPFVPDADASELFGPGPRQELSLNDVALGRLPSGRTKKAGSGPRRHD